MNQRTIRIVAAVVDTRNLTIYREDGTTITIPQGDPRLRHIVESATPQLIQNQQPNGTTWADITLDAPDEGNAYAEFEEKGNGLVKFYRVAKAKLKKLFTPRPIEPVPEQTLGHIPTTKERLEAVIAADQALVDSATYRVTASLPALAAPYGQEPGLSEARQDMVNVLASVAADKDAASIPVLEDRIEPVSAAPTTVVELKVQHTMSAVDEILKHAVPVASPDFHEKTVAKQANVVEANGETPKAHTPDDHEDTIIAVVDGKVIPGVEKIKTQFDRAARLGSTAGVEKFLARLATVIEARKHSVEDLLKFMERGDLPIADDGTIIIYKVLRRKGTGEGGRREYKDCHTGNVPQWVGAYVCMDTSLVDHNRNNECSNGLHVARRGYIRGFRGDVCVLAKLAPEDVITVPSYDANKMRVCGYHILHELSDAQYKLLNQNRPITEDAEGKRILGLVMSGHHIHRTHEVRITQQKGEGIQTKRLDKPEAEPVPTPAEPIEVDVLPNATEKNLDQPVLPKDVAEKVEATVQVSKREQAKTLYDAWATAATVDKEERLAALLAFKKASKKSWEALGIPDPTAKPVEQPKPVKTKGSSRAYAPKDGGTPRERIQNLLELGDISLPTAQAILAIKKASKKNWSLLGLTDAQIDEIVRLTNSKG